MTESHGVQVGGLGQVQVAPDVVVATVGVSAVGQDAGVTLADAERSLSAVREAMLAAGLTAADLRSSQTAMWHEDLRDDSGRDQRRVVHVDLGLRITIRQMNDAGELVHAALAAAGPRAKMTGMEFAVSDPAPARARAREAAFADARARARQLAELAGRELGPVLTVSENSASGGEPARFAARTMAAESIPVEPGEQAITVRLQVHWAWAEGQIDGGAAGGPPPSPERPIA